MTSRTQPSTSPGLVVIMGSGETSPTMVTPHQRVLARLGREASAVMLDTPAGFQENATELVTKAQAYFRDSVGQKVDAVTFRSAEQAQEAPSGHALEMARLRAADWVFTGPGSPSYALRTWRDSAVPDALVDVVRGGGAVTMASAASLTIGAFSVPVYEIYKVGQAPHWLEGLDVLGRLLGWRAAVIPHFDNAEGGTHDTRYCYLGERRLHQMEALLPEDAFVLGVDEHTGLILDLGQDTAEVVGRGVVTLRVAGQLRTIDSGSSVGLGELTLWINQQLGSAPRGSGASTEGAASESAPSAEGAASRVEAALEAGDLSLALAELAAWDSSGAEAEVFTRLLAQASGAAASTRPSRGVVAPFVDLLLRLRASARADKRFADSDAIRDGLLAAGIEVRDTPDGAEWVMAE